MTSARWQQLDRMFIEALQLSPETRGEYVDRTCGADKALRTEALALLAYADESGDFLAQPALERLAQVVATDGSSLRPGERVGRYTVVQRLGSGGSGEVWRASDERLGRDVAIKVLFPHLSTDTDRLRRFAEEARAAGALNHSNIVTVHEVGEHHGMPFLVSECLEGHSLRECLDAGAIPVDQAIAIARDIARGLTAAHARGIIHRDIKPDNTFIRVDGAVKILDFGVAKLKQPTEGVHAGVSHTITGVIVGTAGYMAPEQVRGEDVDARADLFALGVMLYEMLSGQHPFKRASTFETLHAILTADPQDPATASPNVPPRIGRMVMRLLNKAPEARFQSAADLAWDLEQVAGKPTDVGASSAQRGDSRAPPRTRWLSSAAAAGVFAASLLLAGGWWLLRETPRPPTRNGPMQFTWALPTGLRLDSPPVVSPDSQYIAFIGKDATGSRLFVRHLASLEAVRLSGTDGAKQPFWSPDSKSVGFFARGKLMKLALDNGVPVAIADAADGRGGTWSASGVIVFAPDLIAAALFKVPADGGSVEAATVLDLAQGENAHRWPVFLPDGIHFLYFVRATIDERRGVYLGRVDRAAVTPGTPLFRSESEAVYVPPASGSLRGDLLYVGSESIEVRSFDVDRPTVTGNARTLALQTSGQTPYHPAMFSGSADVLALAASHVPFGLHLGSVDRDGGNLHFEESEAQNWLRLSPDGQRLAWQRIDGVRGNPDIWVKDLLRHTRVRVTTAAGPDIFLVWSADGKRLAYVNGSPPGRPGQRMLSVAAADGTGLLQAFPCPDGPGTYCEPTDWSPDGRQLIVNVYGARGRDIWAVAMDRGAATQPLLAEPYSERDARLSPDGRWISYVSEESGRPEVSVRNISGQPTRIVISMEGGDQPVWRRDGAELFFVNPRGRLHSVSVRRTAEGLPAFGLPVELPIPSIGFGHWGTQYDVSPDGSRIYFMRRNRDEPPQEVTFVIGWRSLLR